MTVREWHPSTWKAEAWELTQLQEHSGSHRKTLSQKEK